MTVVSDVGECLVVLFPNNKVRILYEERDINSCFIVYSSLLLIRLLLVRLLLIRLLERDIDGCFIVFSSLLLIRLPLLIRLGLIRLLLISI